METSQYESATARLRNMAAESRMRAIESKLALGMTLCAVAETEMRFGQFREVHEILDRLRQAAKTIRDHLNHPGHVPEYSTTDLHKQLAQLEQRAEKIKFELQHRRRPSIEWTH